MSSTYSRAFLNYLSDYRHNLTLFISLLNSTNLNPATNKATKYGMHSLTTARMSF